MWHLCRNGLVTTGHTKSCGCLKKLTGDKNKTYTGYKDISGCFWKKIENGSKRKSRQLEFDITIEEIWELFQKQKNKCALSGLPLKFKSNKKGEQSTASLDRIDSKIGYHIDNVQWVHKDVNRMKMDLNEDEFFELCKLITIKNNKWKNN